MIIDSLLERKHMTKYRLAVEAGIPHATLNDICNGKTKLEKCSAETVYKIAKALNVTMEMLTENGIRAADREHSFEHGLPDYVQQTNLLFSTVCGESCTAALIWRKSVKVRLRRNMLITSGKNIYGKELEYDKRH